MNSDELRDLLHRSGQDLTPDYAVMVQGGMVRGRRRRKRMRAATASAALAAVVVVGVGLGPVFGITLRGGDDDSLTTATDVTSPDGAPQTDRVEPVPERIIVMDKAKTAWVLGDYLDGRESDKRVQSGPGWQMGSVVWRGGLVQIRIDQPPVQIADTPQERCLSETDSGTCQAIANGDWVNETQVGSTSEATRATGETSNVVEVFARDGFRVTASASNSPNEGGNQELSTDPVLDFEQLREMALSPRFIVIPHAVRDPS